MPRNRTTSRRWSAAVLAAAASVAVLLAPAPAGATPTDVQQAADLVAEAGRQLTALDEQIHQAELTVAEQQTAAAATSAAAAQAHGAVAAYEPQLRALAQSSTTIQSRLAAFLTGDSAEDVVQQMTTLDLIASHTEGLLGEIAAAQRVAQDAQAAADAAAATAAASLATLQQQQAEVRARMQQYEADFARLSAAEQAAVTTELAGPVLAVPTHLADPPSEAAATVVRTALAQVGDPYVWGGVGPDGFDCSGLTQYAYAAVGRSLPHSSRAQAGLGVEVPRALLQPGDIVYFYEPVSHVGLYIGDGKMVHARTFGQPVAVTSVDQKGYRGARRVL